MQSDDKPVKGQPVNGQHNPNFLDLLNQTPPSPDAKEWPRPKRFAGLRQAWEASWEQGGFLYERWEDLFQARRLGWHEMANWIKAVLSLAGLCAVIVLLDAAGDITSAALKGLSDVPATSARDGSGLWGTVDYPVRVFLADQAAHLAVAPAALYAFWQLTGLLGLVGGFFGNAGARIAWVLFGIGSLAMIWSAAPAGGRAAATGLAALMWALASIFALRGLTLRPVVHNHPPQYQFSPELHLHATIPAPAPAGDDRGPDNVHLSQR
ncbi:hypothetical protein [Streptomyces eurythermus]